MDVLDILNKELNKALKHNEVPVSAIIVNNNKIIAKAYNKREKSHDVLSHAEILAIKKAQKVLKSWKLQDCELYVTLKPCKMCEEIIKQCYIKNVYYFLEKTNENVNNSINFINIENDIFKKKYSQILTDFFKKIR